MMKMLMMMAVVVLTGCGGGTNIKAEIAGANMEIAKKKAEAMGQPLVDIKVPLQNCIEKDGSPCTITVVVRHPGGAGGSDYVPSPDDPWARVAERLVGGAVTAGGIYLGGAAAAGIVRDASAGIVDALKVQPAPTVVDPVIVPAPSPVIVPQPAPVIVPPPEPVIIQQPVIVQQETQFGP